MLYRFFMLIAILLHAGLTEGTGLPLRPRRANIPTRASDGDVTGRKNHVKPFRQRQTNNFDIELKPTRLAGAALSDLEKARAVVEKAIREAAVHNKARVAKAIRNHYGMGPNSTAQRQRRHLLSDEDVEPLYEISDGIRNAAALVAEANAHAVVLNRSSVPLEKRGGSSWWMADIKHNGWWPWGKNADDYKVFRNVKEYGAMGDGVTVSGRRQVVWALLTKRFPGRHASHHQRGEGF